jgi:YD repeat-containing protein
MNQIASLLLTATFTLIAPPAYADVNMMEASFRTTFTDAEINGLKIQRRYDSRSNFSGLFGFGWCSTFDTRLEFSKTKDGRQSVQINDCGKLSASPVHYRDQTYLQTLSTGLTRIYDADTGELTRLKAAHGREVAIERPRHRLPRAAALGEGLKERQILKLTFDSLNENVTALKTPDGKQLEFTYDPDRNLLSAKNAWNNTYLFDYDPLHNLIKVSYPDKTSEQMTYDVDHDRLLSFQGRDGCEETYSHQITAAPESRHQTSTARLTCSSKLKREVRFDFTFSRLPASQDLRPDARWFLKEMNLTRDGKTQTTTFPRGLK